MITVAPPGFDERHLATARAAIDAADERLDTVNFVMMPAPWMLASVEERGPVQIGTARRITMICDTRFPADHRFVVWSINDAPVPPDVNCPTCLQRRGIDLLCAHVAWQVERERYVESVSLRMPPIVAAEVTVPIADQLAPSISTEVETSDT
jgi:hypothetical protein